jgi:hypothetical protein
VETADIFGEGAVVTIEELIAKLEAIRDDAAAAMPECAMAMADTYKTHLITVTLRRSFAAPGQFGTPAPVGSPVAWRTGALAASVTAWPGVSTGFTATAHVAPHTVYAATQEYGRHIYARRFEFMHWRNTGGEWWKKHVYVPPRPYLHPALADVVADGSLVRAAAERFASLTGI